MEEEAITTFDSYVDDHVSPHFLFSEFACHDGSEHPIAVGLIAILEAVRARFGPVKITSGYRSASYNEKIGGVKNSYHVKGMAADIQVEGREPKEVFQWIDSKFPDCGLGLYRTFVHVDCRSQRARWER